MAGDGKAGEGGGGPKPGDGYAIEIASVRKVMNPLEESVIAAHRIKNDWKSMAADIHYAATIDIEKPAKDVLSEWGFGMGRLAEHTEEILRTLQRVISAYIMADLLRVKDFSPTEDNMAKLPVGDHGLETWKQGDRGKFDPAPKSLQEQWEDDAERKDGPSRRVEGGQGWVGDGGELR
ncbi:hypothetical protein [Streptomyces spirodelae]|uniref:WXG100 family type VII secretion target n=1 Tax=Streptomyces spirodelae TaxID=2812904 RepID=A0ABS3WUM5_9ACTN|nr:hypothetical protein [Streptomyces spirodelae]MBO8186826.1 hypothetical protein [Streptomyces spirodelae]